MLKKLLVTALLAGSCVSSAMAEPLKIGVTVWPGWMPWWIVEEKNYFEQVGVEAEIIKFKRHTDDMTAFAAKKLDATHMTISDVVIPAASGVPGRIVLITDESAGADGILAKTGIASAADFKGKRVAYEFGSVSQLLVMRALEKEGLTLKDVRSINMSAEDAGTAFLAGAVDVAVTWEPYLSQGSKDGKGSVVFSTADTPGLVPDLMVFRDEAVKTRGDDIQKILEAWKLALKYIETNHEDAVAIMAKGAGISTEEMKEGLAGIKLYSIADNVKGFGQAPDGDLYKNVAEQIEFLLSNKVISKKPDVESLIVPSFVNNAQ
jgi:NitT/TauT family transport system substrate-binding protein